MKTPRGAIFTITVVAALLSACSSRPVETNSGQPVTISTSLKELGLGSNITRVVLEVSGSGFSKVRQELPLVEGMVRAVLEVPFGPARVFELAAYDEALTMLYYGADTSDVSAGSITEILIYMRPQVPMVKISPLYKKRALPQQGAFDIEVYNIDSLFGIALRVEIDSTVISFTDATQGDFLGPPDSTLFLPPQLFPDYLPIGCSMRGNQKPQGKSGSGVIATVTYSSKAVGICPLRVNPNTLTLIDWQGNPLPREGQLYIENGEVEVVAEQ